MIKITLPDGAQKQFEEPIDGFTIARTISEGFAGNCVAMEIHGKLVDMDHVISSDTGIRFITRKDPEALEVMRHTAAHVMAQAVRNLYKGALLTIGPVIEDGFYYDFDMNPISEEDFPEIEAEMKRIIKERFPIRRREISKAEALDFYKKDPYKQEIISELGDDTISFYDQGDFTDLCRGPHLPDTGFIKAFKLMKVSGAYWRGDSARPQLQRIYGTAFYDKKDLNKYLNFLEEARKRDHRKIGTAQDLFSFSDQAPGMPFFHPNGMEIWNALLDYWREEHRAAGYVETKTPVILNRSLWEQSGHWENYRENMYTVTIDETESAIKPMNCPGGMILFKRKRHSYRDMPIRASEIGLVHRHELSGVLSGLFRVRAFHQDDAHIFMTPSMIEEEIVGVLTLVERMYSTFGLGFHLELSTRPEKSIGSDAQWDQATSGLKAALVSYGADFKENQGDGAFYGPKIDIHIKDAIGRTWQCGTIQLDMSLPERFDLSYVGEDNEKHRPVMIHRVIFGSIERFLGILVEHYAGRFPLWLSPVQAIILPINDSLAPYAFEVNKAFFMAGIRSRVDDRTESLNRKVREAQLLKIPLIITLGEKEKEGNTFAVRTLDGEVRHGVDQEAFIRAVTENIAGRFQELNVFDRN